ncbi:alpha-taxilin [Vespa crabro]|uniref:alpha-taxilin n=1 Tax=Vespa crabro TaxID=7445 RepID=UPI001F01580D|nr:alpha-taxilin [Vespa crabro]XP_046817654.1 alpha-taxilin [Vespa crabro]XP_046817655.1 alpha-taxilin [Vespa crabro]XP_046817656.1 alpha-taxilin [Vespa crabro]XP_046817657.1 alpha-taxilin [Vespa crabro]XP_046817660.1 alpha-taxilin [Vespa crabro]
MMDEINDKNSNDESPSTEEKNEIKPIDRTKERKRSKEEKSRKKEIKKTGEQCLEAVNDVQTLKEKLDVMSKKYSDIVDDNKRLLLNLKQSEKKIMLLQREKEQFQSERNKALLTRKRLENLCRELQKQNKTVKEECLSRLKKEEEKRKELSGKFQSILAHINQQMNLTLEKNAKMQEENLEMNKLFKSLCDEVAVKEKQLLQEHMRMKGELLIARDNFEEVKIEATVEKEVFLREKQQLLLTLTEYRARIQELQGAEAAMKSQIDVYTNKYDEFQNSLTRSNKVCGEFNEEMERMSKKILALEKETSLWKQRWEKSNTVFVDMVYEKQARESELVKLKERLALLQDLCRMFQHERRSLIAQLNEKNAKTNTDSTTRTSGESKEKEDDLNKGSTLLENSNGQFTPTNILELLEQRLEMESNVNSTTEKKTEISSEEKIIGSSISEHPLSSEPNCKDKELKEKDLPVSQENRTEETLKEEKYSNVETVVENNSKTRLNIAGSSSDISIENLNEKENKEAIERISDISCDNITELESRSENIENDSTIQMSILKKNDVQTEQQEIKNSSREENNEQLVENIENRCTGITISEIETEIIIEECVLSGLLKKDIANESLESSNNEIEINLCDKLQEINTIVENIQEIEKSKSEILKNSTEANSIVEKEIKTDTPFSKEEDNKSIKQNVMTATKYVRRKKK